MSEIEWKRRKEGFSLEVDGLEVAELDPTEMLRLSEEMKERVVENADRFDTVPKATVKVRDCDFFVSVGSHYSFWEKVNAGEWEPETFAIFDRFLHQDVLFVDVGAWIGPTSLYGARRAGKTVAFEPDPSAFEELRTNLALNEDAEWSRRISIRNTAVSTESGKLEIGSKGNGGDSMTSALFVTENQSWEVEAIGFDIFLNEDSVKNEEIFCKMDIEGFEYTLIPALNSALKDKKISLLLSLHPELLMESILHGRRNVFAMLVARWKFFKKHVALFRALPFRQLEYVNGKPFKLRRELIKSFLSGSFPHGVVCTGNQVDKS